MTWSWIYNISRKGERAYVISRKCGFIWSDQTRNDKNTLSYFRKWDHESVSETHLTKGLSTRPQCLRLMFEINQRNWNAIVYFWRMCISNRELSMGDPFDTIVYIFMQINENFINKNKNKYNRCNEKYYLQRRLEQSQRHKRNKTKQRSLNRIKKINKVILYKSIHRSCGKNYAILPH